MVGGSGMGRMYLKFKGGDVGTVLEQRGGDSAFYRIEDSRKRKNSGLRDPAPLSLGAVHGGQQAAEEG